MYRRFSLSILISLTLTLTSPAPASVVAHWAFDEGSGGAAADDSGNGHAGTVTGATWATPGWDGAGHCLDFDGQGTNRLEAGTFDVEGKAITIACWYKADNLATPGEDPRMISKAIGGAEDAHWWMVSSGRTGGQYRIRFRLKTNDGQTTTTLFAGSSGVIDTDVWTHMTATWDGAMMRIYKDGQEVGSTAKGGDAVAADNSVKVAVGNQPVGAEDRPWDGMIDDVFICNRAVSPDQIQDLMNGIAPSWPNAYDPVPEDGALHADSAVTLYWSPGDNAVSHDLYMSDNYDDVAAGAGNAFQGNYTTEFALIGYVSFPFPEGLVSGTTYYWRIDEVEADETKHVGKVWSFTVPPKQAYNPTPADGSMLVEINADLAWEAGFDSILHYVYFGDDFDTIANASGATPHAGTSYDPGPLDMEKTYYWRVDELDIETTHKGDVWSFTTTMAGLGSIVMERWPDTTTTSLDELKANPDFPGNPGETIELTEFMFDGTDTEQYGARIYGWLYAPNTGDYTFWLATDDHSELWLSSNEDPENTELIANVPGWSGVNEFDKYPEQASAPVPLVAGNRYYVEAIWREGTGGDHCNVTWAGPGVGQQTTIAGRYLSPFNPVTAYGPAPSDGAVDVKQDIVLTWKPGKYATSHSVYFGASQVAVEGATTASTEFKGPKQLGVEQFDPDILSLGTTYYWRIDEVNNANPDSPWTGPVWSFTTGDFLVIDDMEDYNNFEPDRIFETWIDGWGNSANGSIVGYPEPDFDAGETFVETSIVHGGDQSMPLFYDDNMKYSEATMTLPAHLRDWTQEGVKALSLWYYGSAPSQGGLTEGPAGTYTMTGAGEDIWGTSDQFHCAYKMLNGPGSITARVDEIIMNEPVADEPWVKGGIMIRNTLDPNSMFAGLYMTSGSGCRFQARVDTAASAVSDSSVTTLAGVQVPHWIRLERDVTGNLNAFDSNDGVAWYPLAWNPVNIQMNATVYIGLALTSHTGGLQATAVFSNVSTTGNVSGATFTNTDIGIQSNAPEPMFVSIKDAQGRIATVYNPDAAAANVTAWTQWGQYGQGIALTEFTTQTPGLDLANLDAISLGFGTKGNTQPAGAGLVFFDDIRLYKPRCVPQLARPAGDFSNNCVVDMADLEIMTDQWLNTGPGLEPDLNADESVDFMDYAILVDAWLDEVLRP